MKRKAWIKRKRKSVKLDVGKTVRMWAINIFVVVVVALLLASLAHAQPEMKVGQVVEFYSKGAPPFRCKIKLFSTIFNTKYAGCSDEHGTSMPLGTEYLTGYRILKPAPRPEFKLPSIEKFNNCEAEHQERAQGAVEQGWYPINWCQRINWHIEDFESIADELRYLRKEIEGLKK